MTWEREKEESGDKKADRTLELMGRGKKKNFTKDQIKKTIYRVLNTSSLLHFQIRVVINTRYHSP